MIRRGPPPQNVRKSGVQLKLLGNLACK